MFFLLALLQGLVRSALLNAVGEAFGLRPWGEERRQRELEKKRLATLTRYWDGRSSVTRIDLGGCALRGAWLEKADLTSAILTAADLSGSETILSGARFYHANLVKANLRGAWLDSCDFHMADLREADLRGALLEGVHWGGADLRGADLREARSLRGKSMVGTKVDKSTRWPDGFEVPDTVVWMEEEHLARLRRLVRRD